MNHDLVKWLKENEDKTDVTLDSLLDSTYSLVGVVFLTRKLPIIKGVFLFSQLKEQQQQPLTSSSNTVKITMKKSEKPRLRSSISKINKTDKSKINKMDKSKINKMNFVVGRFRVVEPKSALPVLLEENNWLTVSDLTTVESHPDSCSVVFHRGL